MLSLQERVRIVELLEAGVSIAEIARRTDRSVGTIYTIKKSLARGLIPAEELAVSSKILPVKDFIDQQIKSGATNTNKLYATAQAEGYQGGYNLLKNYIWTRQHDTKKPYRRSQYVETTPGEQAQVDWGSFGRITIRDRAEPLYAFVYVLSYSRAIYVEFVIRQNQQTLHSCHEHAFAKLGIPKSIRYDNMKTVVLRRERLSDGNTKDHITPAFKDFARYYGFNIELCPRYWPRAKGKVEAMVKYLRHNFMEQQVFGKTFTNLDEINDKAGRWIEEVAQQRIHRSTTEKPYSLWQQEKRFLEFPKLPPYNSNPFLTRRSTKDGLVQYKANLYAVPMAFAQKKLAIREIPHHGVAKLEIYYKHTLITKHIVSLERGKWVLDGEYFVQFAENDKASTTKNKPEKTSRPKVTIISRGLHHYNNFIPTKEENNG